MLNATIHSSDNGIANRRDYCSISTRLQERLGVERRAHVRVDCPPYAAYYRVYNVHENHEHPFRVREPGLDRLGVAEGTTVDVSATVPREEVMEARRTGGFAETVWDDGTQDSVLVTAPHGGDIEFGTDDMAVRTYNLLRTAGVPVSLWACHGFNQRAERGSAYRRWHISKPTDSPESYPGLRRIADREFDHVIAFHLHTPSSVEVGGRADEGIRAAVGERLDGNLDYPVETDVTEMANPATHERISVNALSKHGGLSLELPPPVCYTSRRTVAVAVKNALEEVV